MAAIQTTARPGPPGRAVSAVSAVSAGWAPSLMRSFASLLNASTSLSARHPATPTASAHAHGGPNRGRRHRGLRRAAGPAPAAHRRERRPPRGAGPARCAPRRERPAPGWPGPPLPCRRCEPLSGWLPGWRWLVSSGRRSPITLLRHAIASAPLATPHPAGKPGPGRMTRREPGSGMSSRNRNRLATEVSCPTYSRSSGTFTAMCGCCSPRWRTALATRPGPARRCSGPARRPPGGW